jgi:CelD/BcsL family acetyltransferase involved in cellulose biosynthesis
MVHLELLEDQYEQAWDDLVAQFDSGTIFHTWAWMRVIEALRKAETLPFGIFDGSDLIGVFPLFRIRRGPLTILASPLGRVGYGGPLVDRSYYPTVFEHLDGLRRHLGVDYIELRALDNRTTTMLSNRHYTVEELQTIVLSLDRDPEDLWSNLERRCRRSTLKAVKNNVEIFEATDTSYLDVYYAMAVDTYNKSNRRPPLSQEDHSTIWAILRPYDRIKVLLARHDDQVIAAITVLCFHGRIYGWDAVAFRSHYNLCPNNLLHWTLIKWGARNGLERYDMTGANIPSIARFKKSFGGELQKYVHAYKSVTWRAYLGRRVYFWVMPKLRHAQAMFQPG